MPRARWIGRCASSNVLRLVAAAALAFAPMLHAQASPELSSLDMWIMQRYRGARLLPDSGLGAASPLRQAGAPRVESTRTPARRDTVVALHFEPAYWRATLGTASSVQLADPTGVVSAVAGHITARRAFRAPRTAGARDTVPADWRIGWAYLVAIPARTANAAASGFGGWAIVEAPTKRVVKATKRKIPMATTVRASEVPPVSSSLPPFR